MTEEILSTGIDIGTTTTHLIISRLVLTVKEGFGCAPKVEITKKEIIYMSNIYFTPLESDGRICAAGVKNIIDSEYKKAGISPDMLESGAVIITGESARRRNAKELIYEISEYAGDFIVAEAGGTTESVLAGKGVGARRISEEEQIVAACVDIGGGTTNISIFDCGKLIADSCIDAGGRMIRTAEKDGVQTIVGISPYALPILKENKIDLTVGDVLGSDAAQKTADALFEKIENELDSLPLADIYIFSGGVSECMLGDYDDYRFGDMGVLLARCIKNSRWFAEHNTQTAGSPIRATVIGAGNYSFEISGSTIACIDNILPVKNIPCAGIKITCRSDIDSEFDGLKNKLNAFTGTKPVAVAFEGYRDITADDMMTAAKKLTDAAQNIISDGRPLIAIIEQDIGKAFGVCLGSFLPPEYPIICIDCIAAGDGTYIDIAKSVGGGKAVPVSVKQLVFS